MARRPQKKVRYGVVGLGWFAQTAVLPAFVHAKRNSELAALFSDDPKKLKELGRKYRTSKLHSYSEYDKALAADEVDAVYIALPNDLHREYTERAARQGVHVLCEKPMAVTEADCKAMIRAAARNGVKLLIAYRLHFERASLAAVEIVNSGEIGEPRIFNSVFTNEVRDPGNIRLNPISQGGGTLFDIGIYCLNAARSLFRSEPTEVVAFSANNGQERFSKCDEMTSALLRFPGERLATFTSSFGAAPHHFYEVVGTKGSLRVEPAFEFAQGIGYRLTLGKRTQRRKFPKRDQLAPELLYFSECVLENKEPEPSGREGLADVRVIRALNRSVGSGRPVKLSEFQKRKRPSMAQEIRRPPVAEPELVGADKPSGD
jgi:glucose-fructose oxidoreductase